MGDSQIRTHLDGHKHAGHVIEGGKPSVVQVVPKHLDPDEEERDAEEKVGQGQVQTSLRWPGYNWRGLGLTWLNRKTL